MARTDRLNEDTTMNVKLKVLTAAILAGFVGSVAAQPIPGTPPPPVVPGGVSPGTNIPGTSHFAPRLLKSEMGAYALLEGVAQAAEGVILGASSCADAADMFALKVDVAPTGTGTAVVKAGGATLLSLAVSLTSDRHEAVFSGGYQFDVSGSGQGLSGIDVDSYDGTATYDFLTGLMTLESDLSVFFANKGALGSLHGAVIKDFKSVPGSTPTFVDYGYQVISKDLNGTMFPQAKYWQTSRSNRSDGVVGRTLMNKQRVYSGSLGGGACTIVINISRTNTADSGFHQVGALVIKPSNP